MKEQIQNLSEEFFDEIVSVRRHLHMNPELSFEEYETSKYIKQLLLSWKIDYEDDFEKPFYIKFIYVILSHHMYV